MKLVLKITCFILIFFCNLSFISTSKGDQLDEFQDCLKNCTEITWSNNTETIYLDTDDKQVDISSHEQKNKLPSYLKFFFWDHESNCNYKCQRKITILRKKKNEETFQFYGKWPFIRIFGIQEFFSALFSFLNFLVHFRGFKRIAKEMVDKKVDYYLKSQYHNILFYSIISMATWISSTLFHIRDLDITEKFDYFFAGFSIFFGFYLQASRFFMLYMPDKILINKIFTFFTFSFYFINAYFLRIDWLYSYNMKISVFLGLLQNIFLFTSCFKLYYKYFALEKKKQNYLNLNHLYYINFSRIILPSFFSRSPKLYSLYPLVLTSIVLVGITFEFFDFYPIFDLIDSHSIWHLITIIPIYFGFYEWNTWDINENVWKDIKVSKERKTI